MKNDIYQFDEEWERDDPKIKDELMLISHNIDPYSGNRVLTKNAINWQSRNSLYTYRRNKINEITWEIGLYPVGLTADTYYNDPKYKYEVVIPEEFLNDDLFMKKNIGDL